MSALLSAVEPEIPPFASEASDEELGEGLGCCCREASPGLEEAAPVPRPAGGLDVDAGPVVLVVVLAVVVVVLGLRAAAAPEPGTTLPAVLRASTRVKDTPVGPVARCGAVVLVGAGAAALRVVGWFWVFVEVRGAGLGAETALFARLLRVVSSAFLFVPFIPEEIVVVLGSCE